MTNLEIATHYFALSNEGDLATIRELFDDRATYSSGSLGLFFGVPDIMKMMTAFFSQYSERTWTIETIEETKPNIVRIDFSFQGRLTNGETQSRRGVEHIVVDERKIRHIEVR